MTDHASFKLRRIEVTEGEEAMLLQAGWDYIGPAQHKDTNIGKYWINPRSGRRYTQRVAVDIEELRESGGEKQKNHLENLMEINRKYEPKEMK